MTLPCGREAAGLEAIGVAFGAAVAWALRALVDDSVVDGARVIETGSLSMVSFTDLDGAVRTMVAAREDGWAWVRDGSMLHDVEAALDTDSSTWRKFLVWERAARHASVLRAALAPGRHLTAASQPRLRAPLGGQHARWHRRTGHGDRCRPAHLRPHRVDVHGLAGRLVRSSDRSSRRALYGGAVADRFDWRRVALLSSLVGWASTAVLAIAWADDDGVGVLCHHDGQRRRGDDRVGDAAGDHASACRSRSCSRRPRSWASRWGSWSRSARTSWVPRGQGRLCVDLHRGRRALLAGFLGLWTLPRIQPELGDDGVPMARGLRSVAEGLAHLRGALNVRMSFVVDIIAMTFGQPMVLFLAVGAVVIGGGSVTAGLLPAAFATAGSLEPRLGSASPAFGGRAAPSATRSSSTGSPSSASAQPSSCWAGTR